VVEKVACGLHQAGLAARRTHGGVGANRPRLYATMLAAQSLGAIPVPLYQDAVAAECVFPINNAECAFAWWKTRSRWTSCWRSATVPAARTHHLRRPARPAQLRRARPGRAGRADRRRQRLWAKNPGWFKAEVDKAQPDDVAAMFFTSGTTGNPKGVVHTHNTLLDRAGRGAEFDKLTSPEEVLAYLPPAWIGQNIFSYAQWLACGYVVNCPESASHRHRSTCKEIGPTYYFAPPRVFEGLLTSVMIRMEDAGPSSARCSTTSWTWPARGPDMMDGKPVGLIDR
jgi:long-chain acyl-CoA synthetase